MPQAGVPVVTAELFESEALVAEAARIVVVVRRDGRVEVDHSLKLRNDGVALRRVMRRGSVVPYVGELPLAAAARTQVVPAARTASPG